jgi:hypothetical protein
MRFHVFLLESPSLKTPGSPWAYTIVMHSGAALIGKRYEATLRSLVILTRKV